MTGTGGDLAELRGDGWRRLLAAARRRLERNGGALDGTVALTTPSDAERRIVIGLTGSYRAPNAARLRVPLADLDRALRQRHGRGLADTLAALDGRPLQNRPAMRADEAARIAAAHAAAAQSPMAAQPWFTPWLDSLVADGTLTRLARADALDRLDHALAVLAELARLGPSATLPLPVLAERTTGDTKALGPDSPLATLLLRALAARAGLPKVPRDSTARRALWESAGVVVDDLASQVLVLNLRCAAFGGLVADWLNSAAAAGVPFRLTLHQLSLGELPLDIRRQVFVCENPAVLRTAAAELGPACPPLVCTEGVPSAACHRLMAAAAARGVRPHWRADFDWTGLRITADAIVRHGAVPWRMEPADYRAALVRADSTPLTGHPAASPWEPALAAALAATGRAVMEERLLPALLADLSTAA